MSNIKQKELKETIKNLENDLDESRENLSGVETELEETNTINGYQVWGDMSAEKSSDAYPMMDLCSDCVSSYEVISEEGAMNNSCEVCGCEDNTTELENKKNEIEEEIINLENDLDESREELSNIIK
jgi:uncharacterized coiled-coil DUF342 family protein